MKTTGRNVIISFFYNNFWNAYNQKNIAEYYWNADEQEVEEVYQWGLLPIVGVEWEF